MSNLAIIPARGGSKRILRKNIKDFLGKPIIIYSIESALNSGLFDEVMVSTDDVEIANIALQYGAKVPFLRSIKTSDDYATTFDVIEEVIEKYELDNFKFKNACCIYPTVPFINGNKLKEGYEKLIKEKYDSVFPVMKFSYPIQRSLKITKSKVELFYPQFLNTRSQDLEESFHDAGQFYWFDIDKIKKNRKIITDNSGVIVIDEKEGQDIDNETDWLLAEMKYKLFSKNENL